jgi:LysM repeat protein
MQSLRQLGYGFLLGALSIFIVLGAFSLAMAEGDMVPSAIATQTPQAIFPTEFPTLPLISSPVAGATSLPSLTPSPTITAPPPPTSCPPPANWQAMVVQPYDSLASLAQAYQTTPDAIRQANCLLSDDLVSGSFLYVPILPTITRVPCGAPIGWVIYIVKPGDSLYRISLLYRVSVGQLQSANCMVTTLITAGQRLYVPNVATSTPSFTPWLSETPSQAPTETLTAAPPTETPPPPTTEIPSSTPTTSPPTNTTAPPAEEASPTP